MKPADVTARRKALGLSQPRLAALLGVNTMTVNRWEKGHQAPPPYLHYALRGIACERLHATYVTDA